ncbi:MAG: indole-3-glycerol phosphate synthase TrpC [Deltaproteobacteria bacterium]|nr:indole-3-glycerol phosphate synthase TrpC [Deltaproteobacteria bacterium]
MSTILARILATKREEVAAAKSRESADALAARARACTRRVASLRGSLERGEGVRVIAEIKRKSPSKGEIRRDCDPVAIARAYTAAGAAAISVLTDEQYFGGSLSVLEAVRAVTPVPLLRKDFVVDAYQIDEARVAGADAVLLIVAALSPAEIAAFAKHAASLGLEVLVEVHDEAELEVALASGAALIGINNRDLRSFHTDLGVTQRLAPRAAGRACVVAESGIFGPADVERLARSGAHGYLVGESLMREPDVGLALRKLRGIA